MCSDLWAASQGSPSNSHHRKDYLAATRAYILAAAALGETVNSLRSVKPEPQGFVFELARARQMLEAKTTS